MAPGEAGGLGGESERACTVVGNTRTFLGSDAVEGDVRWGRRWRGCGGWLSLECEFRVSRTDHALSLGRRTEDASVLVPGHLIMLCLAAFSHSPCCKLRSPRWDLEPTLL